MTTIVTLKKDNETVAFSMLDDRDPVSASQSGGFEITAALTTDGRVVDESIVFASTPGSPTSFSDTADRLDELVEEYKRNGWTFASRRSIDNRSWVVTVDDRTESYQGASATAAAIRVIAEQQGDAAYAGLSTVDLLGASATDRDGRQVWGPIRVGTVDVIAATA